MMISPVTSFKANETTPCANCQKPDTTPNVTAVDKTNQDSFQKQKQNQPSFGKESGFWGWAFIAAAVVVGIAVCGV